MTNEEAASLLQTALDTDEEIEVITRAGAVAIEKAIVALEEREVAEWKPLVTLNGNERAYCCSNENCGRLIAYEVVSGLGGLPNYCPWCGARMEVDECR